MSLQNKIDIRCPLKSKKKYHKDSQYSKDEACNNRSCIVQVDGNIVKINIKCKNCKGLYTEEIVVDGFFNSGEPTDMLQ